MKYDKSKWHQEFIPENWIHQKRPSKLAKFIDVYKIINAYKLVSCTP